MTAPTYVMQSFLPSILVLGAIAVVAAWLAKVRPVLAAGYDQRRAAALMYVVAIIVQTAHFGEEAATGFHERFPALLGLPPMPFGAFVAFNLAWIVIWIATAPGLRQGTTFALFAAWFLAIAGTLNGVAHPLLAVAEGGYFPGLFTSPCIGIAGAWLWLRLHGAGRR